MKFLPSELETHVAQPCTTLATCWFIEARDGTQKFFTSHSRNLTVAGNVYRADLGYTPSQITTSLTLAVDNLDVQGFTSVNGFTTVELLSGKWDNARVDIFQVNYEAPDVGDIKLRRGWVGEVQFTKDGFQAEIRGITDRLRQKFIEVYTPLCRADLGDSQCKVRLDPPTWQASTPYTVRETSDAATGSVVKPIAANGRHFKCVVAGTSDVSEPAWDTTIGNQTVDGMVTWEAIQALTLDGTVTAVTDDRIFTDSGRIEANDFWANGKVTWNTGLNAGLPMEVKISTDAGVITLVQLMPFTIAVSDTYTIESGCFKALPANCRDKFDNVFNFRGEPYVPQRTEISQASEAGIPNLTG